MPRTAKQTSLIKDPRKNTKLWWIKKQTTYGGSMNYRKVARPFDSKKLVHVVFKAKLGSGIWFTRSQQSILALISATAARYKVKLKDIAINKDHIHIVIDCSSKNSFILFLRLFSGKMGQKYKMVFQRFGLKKTKNLWAHRPFTRLVSRGIKSILKIKTYLKKNREEVLGHIKYSPRNHRLNAFLRIWQEHWQEYWEKAPT